MTHYPLHITGPDTFPGGAIGLGVFDGFHLGHQQFLHHCDALLSLFPHPRNVLRHETCRYLLLADERHIFFTNTYVLDFTKHVATLSPDAFLSAVCDQLNPTGFVVGYDFHFGYERRGNAAFLQQWCDKHHLTCRVISPFSLDDCVVKSGTIRSLIEKGCFNQAIALLGHPYYLRGRVVSGDGRGKSLGFPTANLHIDPKKCLFSPGVYSASWLHGNTKRPAIIYLGSKPTFHGETQQVEVHIPNFDGDLYGQHLALFVHKQLRPEIKFDSQDALIAQIKNDIAQL